MDVVEFVIAPDELGMGTWATLEPVINGLSVVEALKWCERRPRSYAGLVPDCVLEPLRELDRARSAPPTRVQVLGCTCGDDRCSWASVEVVSEPDVVTWRAFDASHERPAVYAGLPAVRFERARYARALAEPRKAAAPVRMPSRLPELLLGQPDDHFKWLTELYMETCGNDWEGTNSSLRAGLRAFARRGDPVTDEAVVRWAKASRFGGVHRILDEAWAARAGRHAPAVLAFDTATAATTVAVTRDGKTSEARHDPVPDERPGHATRLLDLVKEAMAAAAVDWDDVARLAVGTGPGSFTGLRIGVATARGLAQARGVRLVGVSTLRMLAMGARVRDARPVLAVIDARRGQAFVAAHSPVHELLAPAVVAPEELGGVVAGLERTPLAVGDGAIRFRPYLEAVGAEVPADGDERHRVSARYWRAGRTPYGWATAPIEEDVTPDYLRLPDAEIARRAT